MSVPARSLRMGNDGQTVHKMARPTWLGSRRAVKPRAADGKGRPQTEEKPTEGWGGRPWGGALMDGMDPGGFGEGGVRSKREAAPARMNFLS